MNMGRWLPQTIESVLANLRSGDEYFIIDGGSTDSSVDIIRSYENRITGWVSEPDKGYADALAKGFARATGDVLCWINAGDLLLPGALGVARKALEETGADFIFGDDLYINEEGQVIQFSRGHVHDLRRALLYGGWTPLQDACFWQRSLYERVGGIDANLKYAADYDLFLRMSLHGTTGYVPMTFSAFRQHAGQKSIVDSVPYQAERVSVQHRELDRLPGSALKKSLGLLWHGAAIRWRVHVSQRRWHRPDLVGRLVSELSCAQYWPSETGMV
jgi:glycosyltransferase involved in cell wall biosynthesis